MTELAGDSDLDGDADRRLAPLSVVSGFGLTGAASVAVASVAATAGVLASFGVAIVGGRMLSWF